MEGSFGDGMYLKLLRPVMAGIYPCTVTEVKSKGQKEQRIADVLEPVMGSHELVPNEAVVGGATGSPQPSVSERHVAHQSVRSVGYDHRGIPGEPIGDRAHQASFVQP